MRALITGINGFVGQHLSHALIKRGWEVFGMSLKPPFTETVMSGNLLDERSLDTIVTHANPDVVFHLAGFTSVKQSWQQPELAMRVNRDGTENLYKALIRAQAHPRLLFVSSVEVYGIPQHLPIKESDPPQPINPYAQSKLAAEGLAPNYPTIPTIICRSFSHTGPGQQPGFVVPDFAKQIVSIERGQQTVLMVGNLHSQRDLLDVRDVVIAYMLLIEQGAQGTIYNVCSGKSYLIGDILRQMIAMARTSVAIQEGAGKRRPSDIPVLRGDASKITATTGWRPTIPLKKTLRDVLEYYRQVP